MFVSLVSDFLILYIALYFQLITTHAILILFDCQKWVENFAHSFFLWVSIFNKFFFITCESYLF